MTVPTATYLSLSKSMALINSPFDLTVAVSWQGHPIAGAAVDLYLNGTFVITLTMDDNGSKVATTSIPIAGTFAWQAKFKGGIYGGIEFAPSESAIKSITILQSKIATTLTMHAYAPGTNAPITGGIKPLTVDLRGTLRDASDTPLNGKVVDIYKNGIKIGSTTTYQVGVYSYQVTLDEEGEYTFYARFDGDDVYEGC